MGDRLDILDVKILSRLLDNCRESDRQMGLRLGVSGGAVRNRIRKMQDGGIITRFMTRVDPAVFGYKTLYFVVAGEDTDGILEQIRPVGEPCLVVPCVGGITVCGVVIGGDPEQGIRLAKSLMKDIRILSIFETCDTGSDLNLTRTDLGILNEMIRDPRQRIEEMAGRTGLSARTITRCIEKMQKSSMIQFTATYDPRSMGGYIAYVMLIWVDGDPDGMAGSLGERFSKSYLQMPFVVGSQIVLFMYGEDIFKMDQATQEARSVAGVRSVDLFIPKKMSHYDGWLTDKIDSLRGSPAFHVTHDMG